MPSSKRGLLGGLLTCVIPLGVGAVLGAFMRTDQWRLLFATGIMPALLVLLIRVWVPESPRRLCRQGRSDETRKSLAWVLQVELSSLPMPTAADAGSVIRVQLAKPNKMPHREEDDTPAAGYNPPWPGRVSGCPLARNGSPDTKSFCERETLASIAKSLPSSQHDLVASLDRIDHRRPGDHNLSNASDSSISCTRVISTASSNTTMLSWSAASARSKVGGETRGRNWMTWPIRTPARRRCRRG